MSDPNPYQSPGDIDEAVASPLSANLVEEISIETARTRTPLLIAALACGFPGGLMIVSSLLLLTTHLEERLFLAIPGGLLVAFTFLCTSLRAHISTLDRRRDETSARTVVRGYGRLAFLSGLTLLAMVVITSIVLLGWFVIGT